MKKLLCGLACVLLSPGLCKAVSTTEVDAHSAKEIQTVLSHLYHLRRSYAQCLDKAAGTTVPTKKCIAEEMDYQDKRLNKAYQALASKLSPDLQAKLKAEEKIWIQYRDNRCATVIDGLERPELASLDCKVEETGKQASDLEARLFVQ